MKKKIRKKKRNWKESLDYLNDQSIMDFDVGSHKHKVKKKYIRKPKYKKNWNDEIQKRK